MLMLTYFAAMHANAVLMLFLGLPFGRALPWHKLLAASSIANSVVHTAAHYATLNRVKADKVMMEERYPQLHKWGFLFGMQLSGALAHTLVISAAVHSVYQHRNGVVRWPHFPDMGNPHMLMLQPSAGWLLLAVLVLMVALALPVVTKRAFTLFFRVHVFCAFAVGVFVALHGFGVVLAEGRIPATIPGTMLWMVDLVLRGLTLNRAFWNCAAIQVLVVSLLTIYPAFQRTLVPACSHQHCCHGHASINGCYLPLQASRAAARQSSQSQEALRGHPPCACASPP